MEALLDYVVRIGSGNDQTLDAGSAVLFNFIFEWLHQHLDKEAEITCWLQNNLGIVEKSDPSHKDAIECMVRIANEMEGNEELQGMLNSALLNPTLEHYILVVNGTFSDVTLSWGSVVALFYVACRFVVKAAEINSVDLVRSIINWTMPFIRKTCILTWIREQGGWGAIRSYFGTPTWQTVGVFLAGVLTVGLVLYKM